MKKTYPELVQDRKVFESKDLVPATTRPADLIHVGSVTELLAKAQDLIPALHSSLLSDTEGLSIEESYKWLSLVPEALHSIEIAPNRRTDSEKRSAVLQDNRFPTSGAKFHQSNLEQSVYTGQLIDNNLSLKSAKIELEKMLYKYKKKQKAIAELQLLGNDTFLEEKNLELYQLKVVRKIMELKGSQSRNNMLRSEIQEWSTIKEELYQEANANGEVWSSEGVDEGGSQEIPLALRHFQNFLIQVQHGEGSDISSVLNIQGLALTAFKNGMKNNKLGMYLCQLNDAQIELMWLKLYGLEVHVNRSSEYINFISIDGSVNMTYPCTVSAYAREMEVKTALATLQSSPLDAQERKLLEEAKESELT